MAYFLDNVPPSQDTSIYPVGATYKQYVGESTPASLFGGTWTDITSTVAVGQDKIGYIYVQYPNQSDPATIFGGTWLNVSSLYAGLFFRAEGGSSLAFNAGNQLDAFQGHVHDWSGNTNGTGGNGNSGIWGVTNLNNAGSGISTPRTDGTNGTPRTASETRPVNTTIRVWSRSGYSITIWRRTSTATSSIASPTNIVTGIYDSGTNSNGSWIRFTDGTMMQWGTTSSVNTTSALGALYYGTAIVTFPISFISTPVVNATSNSTGFASFSGGVTSVNSSAFTLTIESVSISGSGIGNWQAIGKWK
jgi:hypothetical protein